MKLVLLAGLIGAAAAAHPSLKEIADIVNADGSSAWVADPLAGGRFDTVVTDWPNYEHFQGTFRRFFSALDDGDLRGEDPGWRLHREFYSGIRKFLAPGARM